MSVSPELKRRLALEDEVDEKSSKISGDADEEIVEPTPADPPDENDPEEVARVEAYQMKPFFRRYFLEFIYSFFILATALYNVPINTVMNEKACLYVYHRNSSICSALQRADPTIRNPVLAYTNIYMTARYFVMNVPGGLAAIVVGNYLNRYGFRGPLVVVLAGAAMSCGCQLLTVYEMPASLVYNALADLPGSIGGGPIVISTAIYTNLALRVPHSLRLHRITALSFFSGVPNLIAILSGARFAEMAGIKVLLSVSATILTILAVIVLFFLDDISVPEKNKHDTWRESIWLSLKNGLTTSFNAIVKKRPQRRRTLVICLLLCHACLSSGSPATGGGLAIAYARSVMGYGPVEFTMYSGGATLLAFVTLLPIVSVSKKLKWSPPSLVAGGSVFSAASLLLLGLTEFYKPLFYVQIFVGLPYVLAPLHIYNHVTSLVEKTEVSAVTALMGLIEKFVPLASGSLCAYVYKLTSVSFPGCIYMILFSIYLIPIGLGMYCTMIIRWNKRRAANTACP